MRSTLRAFRPELWLLAAAAACGGSASPMASGGTGGGSSAASVSSSGGGASSSSGAGAGGGAGGFHVAGAVASDPSSKPLSGASICSLTALADCTTSDAMGGFSLGGVAAAGSGLTASLQGFVTGIWPLTPTADLTGFGITLRTLALTESLASSVGASFGATGAIHFEARDGSNGLRAAVSVSASPGGTVTYVVTPGKLSKAATSTTALGNGFIFDLPAGNVTLTFTVAGGSCARNGANDWPAQGAGTMTVPVKAGEMTRASTTCP